MEGLTWNLGTREQRGEDWVTQDQGLVKGGEGLVGSWPMDANLTRR